MKFGQVRRFNEGEALERRKGRRKKERLEVATSAERVVADHFEPFRKRDLMERDAPAKRARADPLETFRKPDPFETPAHPERVFLKLCHPFRKVETFEGRARESAATDPIDCPGNLDCAKI